MLRVEKWSRSVSHLFFIFTQRLLNPPFCVVFVQNPSYVFVCAMCFFFNKQFRTCANALPNMFTLQVTEYMNIVRVNVEFFNGYKKIKKRRTVFLCLLNTLVHRTHPLSSPKNLGEILVPIYRTQGDLVKHSRQKSSFKRQNTAYHRSRIC